MLRKTRSSQRRRSWTFRSRRRPLHVLRAFCFTFSRPWLAGRLRMLSKGFARYGQPTQAPFPLRREHAPCSRRSRQVAAGPGRGHREPFAVHPCGHTFCRACPSCRSPFDVHSLAPSILARNALDDLRLRCRFGVKEDADGKWVANEDSCNAVLSLSAVADHEANACDFTPHPYAFAGCSAMLLRGQVGVHNSSRAGTHATGERVARLAVEAENKSLKEQLARAAAELAALRPPPPPPVPLPAAFQLDVRVIMPDQTEIHFRIARNTPLQRVLDAVNARAQSCYRQLLFRGQSVEGRSAESVGLRDGCQLLPV